MSNSVLGAGFKYRVELIKDGHVVDVTEETNIMPQEAIDHIASLIRGGGAVPISSWYLGLFESNYVPDASVSASDLQATVGESVAYDETARQDFTNAYDGTGFISNVASVAEFTMNATKNIYGAFIVSNATKGGTAGLLLSIARFSTVKQVEAGTILRITAGLTLTPTNNP